MMGEAQVPSLRGKRGLIVGIANEASVATGCARAFVAAGATFAATYLSEKALPHIRAITDPLGCALLLISPGPIRTRAAGGLDAFETMLAAAAATAPEHHLVDIDDVGALAAFLVSDAARHITGTIIPVDGGQHLAA